MYRSCLDPMSLLSGKVWQQLLVSDYIIIVVLVASSLLILYRMNRLTRWRRLCHQHSGLVRDDGNTAAVRDSQGKILNDPHPLYTYAVYRPHRSWLFGELLGVYVYGHDNCTVDVVTKAKQSIELYAGTAFGEPIKVEEGWHKDKIYLPVSGIVKKKRG